MKKKTESIWSHCGFFAFRTPLLPFYELARWSDGQSDRTILRRRLQEIIAQPEVREAIFVASPDLHASIEAWIQQPDSQKGKRTERALVRYFARMAGRATPFGLFAGHSLGRITDQTKLTVPERSALRRHTRLDSNYLLSLVDHLMENRDLQKAFRYFPNSSIYRAANSYRYHESRTKEKTRSYHLVSIQADDSISATLARAKNGASFQELAEPLIQEDVSKEEAEEFIHELIENQVIVADIPFSIHGPEPLGLLIEEFEKHQQTVPVAFVLKQVSEQLASMDTQGLGVDAASYVGIARALEALPAKVEPARLFQVDLIKPSSAACLDADVVAEILKGLEVLHKISRFGESSSLKDFRAAFTARYESREVPLLQALDEESGIGFEPSRDTAPLLDGLDFPPDRANESIVWNKRDTVLLKLITEALRNNKFEIVLNEADIHALSEEDMNPLPDAFAVSVTIGEENILLDGCSGPSGARLLGRFCHADPDLLGFVQNHLQKEEDLRPDAIFAEIVHLPEGRLGNVLCRPSLRKYEIPYLGFSCAAPDHQIPVNDLLVSVRGNRIVLRSSGLNAEIIPRMTTAHNYSLSSLGVYRFLCALQSEGVTPLAAWDWGALRSAPYLPRVVYDKFIFAPAQWKLDQQELKQMRSLEDSELLRYIDGLRMKRGFPRWILLSDGDNRLPVDLENLLSVETLTHLIRRREEATLLEICPEPDRICAQGSEGKFVHEIVIPFVRKEKRESSEAINVQHPISIVRTFPAGSEWLYFKLYTGIATADLLLTELAPEIRKFSESGIVDRWFFIRYSDPDWHLRFRFHGAPESLPTVQREFQNALQPYLRDGRIWRIQIDTYEREIERYGGDHGIVLAEEFFHIDSKTVLEILELLQARDESETERWKLALIGVDSLLRDFEFDTDSRLSIVSETVERASKEFRLNNEFRRKLAEKFRSERKALEFLDASPEEHSLQAGIDAFAKRSALLKGVFTRLKHFDKERLLTVPLTGLAQSFIHMHVNRLLRSSQREQELVLYDFLHQIYRSRNARPDVS